MWWIMIELEKKYAPTIDNYGQSCFAKSDFFKNEVCLYDTNDVPVWPSKSCGHAHLHYVYKNHTKY